MNPEAINNFKELFPHITYCNSPYEAARNADAIIILTEWEEYKILDYTHLKEVMRGEIIIDSRNILNPTYLRQLDF